MECARSGRSRMKITIKYENGVSRKTMSDGSAWPEIIKEILMMLQAAGYGYNTPIDEIVSAMEDAASVIHVGDIIDQDDIR
jgi:hypothetical protein